MDDIIKATKNGITTTHIGYNRPRQVELSERLFAEDLMICAPNERSLKANITMWEQELIKMNKINMDETKVLVVG